MWLKDCCPTPGGVITATLLAVPGCRVVGVDDLRSRLMAEGGGFLRVVGPIFDAEVGLGLPGVVSAEGLLSGLWSKAWMLDSSELSPEEEWYWAIRVLTCAVALFLLVEEDEELSLE